MFEHAPARPDRPLMADPHLPRLPRPAARTRHLTTCTALAVALTGGAALALVPTATPARAAGADAASAPVAPTAVADLNALVGRTAAALTDGTRRLELSQAHLADVLARQVQARSDSQAAAARAQAARARLGEMVGAQYRNPAPSAAMLMLAAGPGGLADSVHAAVALDQVRGSQQQTLAEADRQRRAAETLVAEADQLAGDAAREQDDLTGQVADLQRRAQDANDQLTRASAALQAAQDERAAAAARASRDRSPAGAPPPVVVPAGGGGSCGGGNLSGYPNGMLPTSALCPLDGTNGLVLRADAAAAFNRMAAAGGMPCPGNSYRSYSQQVALYKVKPSLAAVPGTSNHGWGVAIDFACGADSYGSAAYQWLKTNGPRFGWNHPAWAEPGGSRQEPWHWEYTG